MDFCINEPKPFWPGWKSFKSNGPVFHYGVALCICTGDIVWNIGPCPCGQLVDLNIFQHDLMGELEAGEKVEADLGYQGEIFHMNEDTIFFSESGQQHTYLVRACHEAVNKRLKEWNCLNSLFWHNLRKHDPVFQAVASIAQLAIENGEPLFDVEYNDSVHFEELK